MSERAVLPLLRRARQNDAEAQLALGRLYLEGKHGLARSPRAAFLWLEKAALQGVEAAVRLIGDAVPAAAVPDLAAAGPIYDKAAAAGSSHAIRIVANRLLAEAETVDDALQLLMQAAEGGDRSAQLRLACLYQAGDGVSADAERANFYFEKAALQGSLAAQQALADYYWKKNDPRAMTWLSSLAEKGDVQACYRYGVLLISFDRPHEAVAWLRQAAEQGHAEAQVTFGMLHSAHGGTQANGVPHNYKKAAYWLNKAAQQGLAQASYELSQLYSLRSFSLCDPTVAREYLEQGAEQGHAQAQYLLGRALWKRLLEPEADAAAVQWLSRAAQKGHIQARAMLFRVCTSPHEPPRELIERRQAAIQRVARTHLALAMRLELAGTFAMARHELLFIDPSGADRGECLVLDVRQHVRKSRRRIVLVRAGHERDTLDRAKRLLPADPPAPSDLHGDLRRRQHQLEEVCRAHGFEPGLFDPGPPSRESP